MVLEIVETVPPPLACPSGSVSDATLCVRPTTGTAGTRLQTADGFGGATLSIDSRSSQSADTRIQTAIRRQTTDEW